MGISTATQRKALTIVLAVIVIASLIMLAASLSQVKFEGGKPFSFSFNASSPEATADGSSVRVRNEWKKIVFILIWIMLPLSLLSLIIWPKDIKRALQLVLRVLVSVLVLYYIITLVGPKLIRLSLLNREGATETAAPDLTGNFPPFGPLNAPWWSTFLFIFIGLAALALLIWWLNGKIKIWRYRYNIKGSRLPELAGLAGAAAADIRSGMSLQNVILRCYRDMGNLLSERKKVLFSKVMTAREFEMKLSSVGVKDEHVNRLTRLFELVRYGGRNVSKAEEHEAIACLEAIEQEYDNPDSP